MLGVLVNTAAVLIGSSVGLLLNKGIPKRFSGAIMTGIGLCTLYIGISGALKGENPIILVVSIVIGALAGTALKLDERLNSLGERLEKRFAHAKEGEGKSSIAQGFVAASLLFCVGAMTIIGSIESGLTGNNSVIFTKSTMDLISSAMLAVSLGAGVLFAAASVFVYQSFLVLLAQLLRPLLENHSMIAEMNCAGSVIIIALGLNIIGMTKIKIANYLPAMLFAPVICAVAALF